MLSLIAYALVGQVADPTFDLAKTLVGGKWEGQAAPGVTVTFRYSLEQKQSLIVGIGSIDDGKKKVPVRTSFGWDPVVKQVYYLDQHGHDIVYFGHITRKGNTLVFDFNGQSGDRGHYKFEMAVEPRKTVATMSVENKGTWTDLGVHVQMNRKN